MRHFLPFVRRARVVMSAGAIALAGWASTPAWAGEFLIGTGVYDITGPAAEAGMFGYAAQQVDAIAPAAWDVHLDYVATEKELIDCWAERA